MTDDPTPRRAAAPRQLADAGLGETPAKILDAAFRRLCSDGDAALSVREIARDAGVNHALINYHFGSKDRLVIEVLDAAHRRLLARQASMDRGLGGFASKWAEARRFYESDLASGFVRVQAELGAASHLLSAAATTGCILIGIWFEERDPIARFGDRYRAYREQVGMPWPRAGKTRRGDPAGP